jgi:tetratricopeptide (TPR) repeat protein
MKLDRCTITVSATLFLGTLLVFSRAIGNDFVNYDDPIYVTENPHAQVGLTPGGIRWALTTGAAANWHPLTWISHMMDWSYNSGIALSMPGRYDDAIGRFQKALQLAPDNISAQRNLAKARTMMQQAHH